MSTHSKIALALAVVLGTTYAASAATKARVGNNPQAAAYDVIPGYAGNGATVPIPNPNRR
jgi:hypothetical protein